LFLNAEGVTIMINLKLFPMPRQVTVENPRISLAEAEWLVLPQGCSRHLRERVGECAGNIGRALNHAMRLTAAVPTQGTILVDIRLSRKLKPQGFSLTLKGSQRLLEAGDEAGAFYGCLALAQLIEQFGADVPTLAIADAPDFAARGVMLDVSRCKVPTMASCKLLIDRLAGMRINQIQLYTEHTFAFSAHKTVWHDASPFTHEEILELDSYCADRFVELVPNFNSFGHFQRWLCHPEYRHLAECPDQEACSTLAPNAASLQLLDTLYDEFLPNFSSPLFNVGCDETWELGKGRSRKKAEAQGTTAVYLEFLKKIHKLCTKKGKRMQFWGDIILHQPELIRELPQNILALNWGYEGNHPFDSQCKAFADAGIEFHVCPGTSAWNSITGRTGNALANLENAARNGRQYGASGFLITDWGDGGHHQVLPVSYVGFAAGAAYSWCLKTNQDVDLSNSISRHFFDDPTGRLGNVCLELGRTLDRIPGLQRGNCSAINQLLFWKANRLDLSKVAPTQYHASDAWLDKVASMLTDCRPGGSDRDLVVPELRHAVAMSRYALHRGVFIQSGAGSVDALRRELQDLVMSHEDQWLARNRRGGLYESSTILRNTLLLAKPIQD